MTDRVFLDTNLWIYFYAKDPADKSQTVTQLISNNAELIWLSTQTLGELFHVLTRKKFTSQAEAAAIVLDLIDSFPVWDIDTSKVSKALETGVPKDHIVLAFHPPHVREHTGYAIA